MIHQWRGFKYFEVKAIKMLPILELLGLIVHPWIIIYQPEKVLN